MSSRFLSLTSFELSGLSEAVVQPEKIVQTRTQDKC